MASAYANHSQVVNWHWHDSCPTIIAVILQGGDDVVKHEKSVGDSGVERLKIPLNPSVRGTGKQSGREKKGLKRPSIHHGEGTGHAPGGGRGGKSSR